MKFKVSSLAFCIFIALQFSTYLLSAASMKSIIKKPLSFRFLEGNSWVLGIGSLNILVDPVLEGNLDFSIPLLYSGKKKVIDGSIYNAFIVNVSHF